MSDENKKVTAEEEIKNVQADTDESVNEITENEDVEKMPKIKRKKQNKLEEIDNKETEDEFDEEDYEDDDEMLSRTKKSVVSTVITIVVALVAVGALGVAYFSGAFDRDKEGRYNATETEKQQIMAEAQVLLANNYETIRLFYQEGLSHEAPSAYGDNNDGIYKITDTTYDSYQKVVDLINSTYVSDKAAELLNNGQGSGKLYQDTNGVFEINLNNFEPQDYNKNWTNLRYECLYVDEKNVKVQVTLTETTPQVNADGTTSETETTAILSGSMIKTESGWRLTSVIY